MMPQVISPVDVLLMRPEQLDKIKPRNEMDETLIESLRWGHTFHPSDANRTRGVELNDDAVIDWSCPEQHLDVQAAIRDATVLLDIPIAGMAEHLVALRRFTNSQPAEIRNGESWRQGTSSHLAELFKQ